MGKLYIGNSGSTPAIIKVEEVAKKKFGASIDSFIGDVDVDGVLQRSTTPTALNFAGVTEIGWYLLFYMFYKHNNITSVDLSSVQSVGLQGMYHTFEYCTGITSIDLSSLQSVDSSALEYAFAHCKGITGALDLSSLTTIKANGLCGTFYDCTGITSIDLSSLTTVDSRGLHSTFKATGITSIDLSSLTTVDSWGLQSTFQNCKCLTIISFPSLTSVQTNSTDGNTFYDCPNLTEIHFRADMQATIEACTGYADKFGAMNATIYFDL